MGRSKKGTAVILLPKVPRPTPPVEGRIVGPHGGAVLYGPGQAPSGGWHHVILDGRPVPVMYCPKCLRGGHLTDHAIGGDGTISPSVRCPHEGCDFHDNVRLEDWER